MISSDGKQDQNHQDKGKEDEQEQEDKEVEVEQEGENNEEGKGEELHNTFSTRRPRSRNRTCNTGSSERQKYLLGILRRLRRCDDYGFFSRPVDPVRDGCDDYFDVIGKDEAMDLATLEGLIFEEKIVSLEEFKACVDRIVDCARRYNTDELNFVRIQADRFADGVRIIFDEIEGNGLSEKVGTGKQVLSTENDDEEESSSSSSTSEDEKEEMQKEEDNCVIQIIANQTKSLNPITVASPRRSLRSKKRSFRQTSYPNYDEDESSVGSSRSSSSPNNVIETPQISIKDNSPKKVMSTVIRMASRKNSKLDIFQQNMVEYLGRIRSYDMHGLFSEPINPIGHNREDCCNVIDKRDALDLSMMEKMIIDGRIENPKQFEMCLEKIVANARKYSVEEGNFVREQTEELIKKAKPLMNRLKKSFVSLPKKYQIRTSSDDDEDDDDDDENYDNETDDSDLRSITSESEEYTASKSNRRRRSTRRRIIESTFLQNGNKGTSRRSSRKSCSRRSKTNCRIKYEDSDEKESICDESALDGWSKKFPCRAADVSMKHNAETAYFTVTNATKDGEDLICSFSGCREAGIKFVYCMTCGFPVDKNNYLSGHIHTAQSNEAAAVVVENGVSRLADSAISHRHRYCYNSRDAAIPGSSIPPARRDMSTSTVTKCEDRGQWQRMTEEMLTVCNEAARRAKLILNPTASRYDKPLSESYIKERLEYDKALRGYIVRSKDRDDLQGFITSCNFMVFRDTFRWDTEAPQAGITPFDRREHEVDDGSITEGLARATTSGNVDDGLVFHRVAEISLLGGLGCGGTLLKKILIDLNESKEYDYVVLQSTKMAIAFYENHNFVRVGAVARFEDNPDCPEVSYRHWGDIVEGRAVEASYMMALRLPNAKVENFTASPSKMRRRQSMPEKDDTPRTASKKVSALRKAENLESFHNARNLARQALEIVTESAVGRSSYVELLSLSRDATKSIRGKGKIAKEIHRAIKEVRREQSDVTSKEIVARAFEFADRVVRARVKANGEEVCQSSTVAWVPLKKTPLFYNEDDNSADFVSRLCRVHIKTCGYKIDDPVPLTAMVRSKYFFEDNALRCEAAALVFRSFCMTALAPEKVRVGSNIMVRSFDNNGVPYWRVAEVLRKCNASDNMHDMKKKSRYLYECELDNNKTKIVDLCPHDSDNVKNRGIGREWCTLKEWSSFPILSNDILDILLENASVEFLHESKKIAGRVIGRVGGGTKTLAKWRVIAPKQNRRVLIKYFDLSDLRDIVSISADSMKRVIALVKRIELDMDFDMSGNESLSCWSIPRLMEDPVDLDENISTLPKPLESKAVKRKRGRPRKSDAVSTNKQAQSLAHCAKAKKMTKRRRELTEGDNDVQPRKKRGRPRKPRNDTEKRSAPLKEIGIEPIRNKRRRRARNEDLSLIMSSTPTKSSRFLHRNLRIKNSPRNKTMGTPTTNKPCRRKQHEWLTSSLSRSPNCHHQKEGFELLHHLNNGLPKFQSVDSDKKRSDDTHDTPIVKFEGSSPSKSSLCESTLEEKSPIIDVLKSNSPLLEEQSRLVRRSSRIESQENLLNLLSPKEVLPSASSPVGNTEAIRKNMSPTYNHFRTNQGQKKVSCSISTSSKLRRRSGKRRVLCS